MASEATGFLREIGVELFKVGTSEVKERRKNAIRRSQLEEHNQMRSEHYEQQKQNLEGLRTQATIEARADAEDCELCATILREIATLDPGERVPALEEFGGMKALMGDGPTEDELVEYMESTDHLSTIIEGMGPDNIEEPEGSSGSRAWADDNEPPEGVHTGQVSSGDVPRSE